jgi:isoquinoline 1-oxidoreductase alpha subunit
MQAASLLAKNPNPTEQEIMSQMNGNVCRCSTYPRIRAAIRTAIKEARR